MVEEAINTQEKRIIGKPFEAGNPGRPKGSTNHFSKTVKGAVIDAFNKLQEDPEYDLLALAKKNLIAFYQLAAKVIPTEISGHLAVTKTEIKLIFPEPRGTTSNDNGTKDMGSN